MTTRRKSKLIICSLCEGKGFSKRGDGSRYECVSCHGSKTEGCYNKWADLVPRIDQTSSDSNLDDKVFDFKEFERLKCGCGSRIFEVLWTGSYQTSAQCIDCGAYYVVHSG